jgi:hypothetical protein
MADIDKTPDTILPKTAQKLLLTTSVNVYILLSDNLYPIIRPCDLVALTLYQTKKNYGKPV